MRKSVFKEPRKVLIFNGAGVLVAVVRSLHSAAQLTCGNIQAISFNCCGKYISTGGYYFRHLHPDVIIEVDDLDNLKISEYDKLCGEKRRYHTVRKLAKIRARSNVRRIKKRDEEGL